MITLTCVMNNIPDQYAQVFKAVIIVFAVFIQREQANVRKFLSLKTMLVTMTKSRNAKTVLLEWNA